MSILYRRRRSIAVFFVTLFLCELVQAPVAYALTSGPAQPEVQGFQPAGATDMVDLFTGNFSYNIPLFELPGPNGGYPFNLSYQSGGTMDQESSWVGYSWSLNPGAINRQMRGLPDEFNGEDIVHTKMSVAPNVTVGIGAGASLEVFGADTGGALNVGLSVYNNNYKGVGYSIDATVGFQKPGEGRAGAGASLGLKLDSQEGVNVSPSLSLGTAIGEFGLGVGYNSKTGLSNMSLSHDYVFKDEYVSYTIKNSKTGDKRSGTRYGDPLSQSSTLSLAHSGYTPQITMPMSSTNIAATFKAGGAWWGVFASPYVTGFYNEQRLKNDKKRVPSPAFGYLHYQEANGDRAMLDLNREKDGIVSRESPNLPIASLSYDIYSVSGQGLGAMYRPMRNDYGIVHDPEVTSSSTGGSAGVDVGVPAHLGLNLSVNHSKSTSGLWADRNDMKSVMTFESKSLNDAYEPWYFKVHGEPSVEDKDVIDGLGGDAAVRIKLKNHLEGLDPKATTSLEATSPTRARGWRDEAPSGKSTNQARKSRTQVVEPITNEQLLSDDGEEMISQFKVDYIDASGNETVYERPWPAHHTAGFTALTPEGLRYVYAVPAYNLYQEEVTFTAERPTDSLFRASVKRQGDEGDPKYDYDGTDKFLKRVEMPPYAHSYLLTSIVGPDYVDVKNDGVTNDDLGYWVKFTYRKTTTGDNRYKWRDPYSKAHFQEGWKTDPRDDKGSFVYGEKEIWYLARAETKTHIAAFTIEERDDAHGVAYKLQDSDLQGMPMHLLRNIKLYTRYGGQEVPIKTVWFNYDYSLCQGITNSSTGSGKLTLKSLWFEYGGSARGQLNPYEFTYHTNNPDYNILAYDRWGGYKPYPAGDYHYNYDFPYVVQDPDRKEEIDNNAAAWNLASIRLPSGGVIVVDYESDDYAYVQHKQAMQMMELVDPYKASGEVSASGNYRLGKNTKVRFKLEKIMDGSLPVDEQAEVLKYLDRRRPQVYFKIKINLKKPGDDSQEYISGYADVNFDREMGLEKDADGNYAYGFFYLKQESDHHPFSLRAWQHLRTNQPELANKLGGLKETGSNKERVKQIRSLAAGSVITSIRQMFTGFYRFCYNRDWGKEVEAGRSWIRLKSPDKIKYGGGSRVRQVTMKSNLLPNDNGIYGQLYEYTMEEEGNTISSGVAAYEPLIGGDENPLRYAKKYTQSVRLRSDNNLFFEYPVNETYYPGPQVGYRKVTVSSLAAAALAGKEVKNIELAGGGKLFPSGDGVTYGTSGVTVHEFYTAREFPVITDETEKDDIPFKFSVPVPFVGSVSLQKLTASQGYSIITNDMHGRQKMVSNYRQDRQGNLEPEPISWVKYNYAARRVAYEGEKIYKVDNVFVENEDGTLSLEAAVPNAGPSARRFTVGQENEFFADMREFQDEGGNGGVRYNNEFIFVILGVINVPVGWPSIGYNTSQVRTASTNKVIFKSGILQSTEAYDGSSLVKTDNLKWDSLTGGVVLTSVNNNFDDKIYNYTIPAYTQYRGMGAAYQNTGLTFTLNNLQQDAYEDAKYTFNPPGNVGELLMPGDEILLYSSDQEQLAGPVAHVVYTGEMYGQHFLSSGLALSASQYHGMIVRSGYRNQLSVQAGSITALEDPTKPGTEVTFEKTITIPQ